MLCGLARGETRGVVEATLGAVGGPALIHLHDEKTHTIRLLYGTYVRREIRYSGDSTVWYALYGKVALERN